MNRTVRKAVLVILTFLAFSPLRSGSLNYLPDGITIPLKRAGRLFIIEATIEGQNGNFIFDTGASNLVLNQTYFRKRSQPRTTSGGITGDQAIVGSAHVDRLEIGNLVLRDIKADVTNLGHIENRRGIKILGLIGMNLLKNQEMLIDFRNQSLQFFPVNRRGEPLGTSKKEWPPDDLTWKVVQRNGIMFINAKVGGKKLDFCLDTGAESNVLCSSCRKDILKTVTITRRTSLTGIGGQDIEVLYGLMNDFSIAESAFEPMQAIITSLAALSEAYGYPVDGVLGYDFFEKNRIRINLPKKEIGIIFHKTTGL